ncbi:DUF5955 family protein [Streptomyces sp. NPDC047002]|uniref:DUF5955 family protein n=1 Tax=Streptomyces sp. NPDC047002 TaxID=3155475 RepID=UPI0034527577
MLWSSGRARVAEQAPPDGGRAAADADAGGPVLRVAVARLRRQLAACPAEFRDRGVAEEELASLASMAAADAPPELARVRRSLLLVVGSIGSVSALGPALYEVRAAVDALAAAPPSDPG